RIEAVEEKNFMALGEVQRDYQALRATSVVVGRLVNNKGRRRIIEVVRTLKGPSFEPGLRLTLDLHYHNDLGEALSRVPDEGIYFLGQSEGSPKEEDRLHQVLLSQPSNHEGAVRAALKRAAEHPVSVTREAGAIVRRREILFRGSIEETQQLLCSQFDCVS